jgi:bacteriocin biosynthesis cyclodehydratase domain-containing protein
MRPALKAGLIPLWRDSETLQIGIDPRRARALAGLGKAAAVVSLLDGSRDTAEIIATAQRYGISPDATNHVLGLLAAAGVLNDFPAQLHRSLPEYLRARLAPEMACASLAYGDGDAGARTLARRRGGYVRVHGAGRIGAGIATLLGASGVGRVSCADSGNAQPADLSPAGLTQSDLGKPRADGVARAIRRVAPEVWTEDEGTRPDLVVLVGQRDEIGVRELMRARTPHLAVRAEEAIGVVGPLVQPGVSACLRCVDLTKASLDQDWPMVLAQSAPASPSACDTVLAAATAAVAAAQALACIDGAGPPPVAANGTLELVLPDWQWRRRTWQPHPACTCGAQTARDSRDRSASQGRSG